MLIKDNEAVARLQSPMNLINRLRDSSPRKSAMSLFIPSSLKNVEPIKKEEALTIPSFNPFPAVKEPETTIENLVENSEEQVKLSLAHDSALKLLNDSVALLSTKLEDVKAEKLPSVISAASKVVEGIRRDRREIKETENEKEVHYHFYTPAQKTLTEFKVIDVGV